MPGRRTTLQKPRMVVLIGHNHQVLSNVSLFVGGKVRVIIYIDNHGLDEHLAIYPDVEIRHVEKGYTEAPIDLPEAPYFLCFDTVDQALAVKEWLPETIAVFHLGGESRRNSTTKEGLLRIRETAAKSRKQVFRRLSTLRRVDRLLDMARHTELPLILMYGDPDPDAIGSALALAHIWRQAGAHPIIRYTGVIQRYQNKLLINYLKEPIEKLRSHELEGADLIAVVDAQPGFWRNDPPKAHVVIDHHPIIPDLNAAYTDLRPDYGSTATILSEYLHDAGFNIRKQLATALLYGLMTDTNDLQRNATSRDIKAYDLLHAKADQHFLGRLIRSQVPMNVLDYIGWGIQRRLVIGDMMLVHFGEIPTSDVLVQCADMMLLTCGIYWVVCAGKVEDKLVVVFRGDGHRLDVGARAKAAFGKLDGASAGGHRTMARAEIPLNGEHVNTTAELVVKNLFKRSSAKKQQKMIHSIKNILNGPGVDYMEAERL